MRERKKMRKALTGENQLAESATKRNAEVD